MATSEETLVARKLVDILTTGVPALNLVTFDRVRLSVDDIQDHELPAVQLWDLNSFNVHQRGYVDVSWGIALELVMKSTVAGEVTQEELWDLARDIELILWDDPGLDIPGVVHLKYRSRITDLHTLEPFYVCRFEFDVIMRRQLTGSC